MKISAALLALPLLGLISCGPSSSGKNEAGPQTPKGNMSCADTMAEVPDGEPIWDWKGEDGTQYHSTWKFANDTIYHFDYVLDVNNPDKYTDVDVLAMAVKDLSDTDAVEPNEFDIDLTDGTKSHEAVVYFRAHNGEKLFRNRHYRCENGSFTLDKNDAFVGTFTTGTIERAKKLAEEVKAKLKK